MRLILAVKIVNVFLTATVDGLVIRTAGKTGLIITKGLVNLVKHMLGKSV